MCTVAERLWVGLILDLKNLFVSEGAKIVIDRTVDMSDADYSGEYPLKKPVIAKGSISNKASVVTLILKIDYEYSAPCDRCFEPATQKHSITLDKILAASIEGEESDTIITVPDMKLDVDELIFSEVYLSLPTKHLCKETCKGVCATCGKNLNEGECNCNEKEIDPRLQKLAELLK